MEPLLKLKEISTSSSAASSSTAPSVAFVVPAAAPASATMANICSSDSFSIIPPPHHDLMSANSIELNAAASLSDDSGVPLTTNSSISSGDSYRLGMCKFEIEMVESDGEVSQFDSLDNCSEGGMSAENFNTLKKVPLAPIDPPPEFQDSPQTTLVRSISKNIVNSLRRWTSSQSSFEHLKEHASDDISKLSVATIIDACEVDGRRDAAALLSSVQNDDGNDGGGGGLTLKDSYAINKHLYSSDSILNTHTDNIYDEPNNIISSSLGNSVDIMDEDSSSSPLPPPPPPVSIVKIKQTLCPYYQDHTRYFKAIPSEQDNITTAAQKFNLPGLSEIHDYDLYYGAKRNTYQPYDSLQRKLLYSPLHHAHHCHNHHYHAGINTCGNRPNSRNSLNSRLSSSHNSLSVASANKPDDSIFITQAMSHDALLTREISDFYNVPIDSDIYAFPVDMIASADETASATDAKQPGDIELSGRQSHQQKSTRRTNRNKRKKRAVNADVDDCGEKARSQQHHTYTSRGRYRVPVSSLRTDGGSLLSDEPTTQEPLHMSLDEVKQFYHTLYSDTQMKAGAEFQHVGSGQGGGGAKSLANKSSNETIWSVSSTRSRTNLTSLTATMRDKNSTNLKASAKAGTTQKLLLLPDGDNIIINNINNNNNVSTLSNQNSTAAIAVASSTQSTDHNGSGGHQPKHSLIPASTPNANTTSTNCSSGISASVGSGSGTGTATTMNNNNNNNNNNNKQTLHSEKKSQFTLNLKQKFCSIFRFRRNHNRCRGGSGSGAAGANVGETEELSSQSADDKRKKFQSRALPPLPKKVERTHIEESEEKQESKKPEARSFHFASSIEKVKDYGWYWGPLSSEAAEKVLSNEPDGSFIVRDSSDDHYIFSLSFKLNNCVRHVRIEQDQGTFSFGSYAKFKSQTITEFIEKAVEHSRSGRYLFFLHRRPEHGPMRVQLTNPVSRFKHVQSLQHMCRFVILKAVIRKDLIQTLPLPRRLLDYLNYKHCYSEQVESDSSHSQISGEGSL